MPNKQTGGNKDSEEGDSEIYMRANFLGVVVAWSWYLPGADIGRVLDGWHLGNACWYVCKKGRINYRSFGGHWRFSFPL